MKSEPPRAWLADFSWTRIGELNQQLCEPCRKQWSLRQGQEITFRELLEFLRECHRLSPFCFNNGNTFAAVAREIVIDLKFAPEDAAVLRSAAGHFVAGVLREDELDAILADFD